VMRKANLAAGEDAVPESAARLALVIVLHQIGADLARGVLAVVFEPY